MSKLRFIKRMVVDDHRSIDGGRPVMKTLRILQQWDDTIWGWVDVPEVEDEISEIPGHKEPSE